MTHPPTMQTLSARAGWRGALAQQLHELGFRFEGRLVLTPNPTEEVVPAERFLDTDFLRWALGGHRDDATDQQEAVTRFTRHYCSSVSAVALVALANGLGVDLAASRCKIVMWRDLPFRTIVGDQAVLWCPARPTIWPTRGLGVESLTELREHVWRQLYAAHLAPLFERLYEATGVAPRSMWKEAAQWVNLVAAAAVEYLGGPTSVPFVADRNALLSAPEIPGIEGPSPLGCAGPSHAVGVR